MTKVISEEDKRKIGEAHKGRHLSQEARDKIRKKLMGHPVSEATRRKIAEKSPFKKGHIPWNKEQPWSKEMKERISSTNKAKGIEPKVKFIGFGEAHPRWKG